eukprot:CAMPEP_0183746052 /NCGR_PEP_ID=MMETSP0737-20130205/66554_1 /TAXON_ID=385413 /ORGANISM="Thalassiosira miniscula, Strain CCMP1093" /LENGTH=437 /DNA_ID=CAMNT_0025981731 /DNA_START=411 /DNA_END=1724 /DNA_ORIENTATION=+
MAHSKAFGRAARLRRPRYAMILYAIVSYMTCKLVYASTRVCSLDSVSVEKIPLNEPHDGRRHLRSPGPSSKDVVGLRREFVQRRISEDSLHKSANHEYQNYSEVATTGDIDSSETTPTSGNYIDGGETDAREPTAYEEGRECICAAGILPDEGDVFYCPLPTEYCSISKSRQGGYSVQCIKELDWKVGFARRVWFYLCFALLILILYPIITRPGQHAVRYLLSKCFPRINVWIVEKLLQTEMETNNRIREELEHADRAKRRTEGWLSEYRIKTKLYSREDVEAESNGNNNVTTADEINPCGELSDDAGDETTREEIIIHSNDDPHMCTICFLAVESGERIADLSCGHLYHAECLSEWILKKNSCPLCQEPVAREIRCFETQNLADRTGDNLGPESIVSRWRRQARDRFLDVAAGRNRRSYEHDVNRRLNQEMWSQNM